MRSYFLAEEVSKLLNPSTFITDKHIKKIQSFLHTNYQHLQEKQIVELYRNIIYQESHHKQTQFNTQNPYFNHMKIFLSIDQLLPLLKPQPFSTNIYLMLYRFKALCLYRRPYWPILTQLREQYYLSDLTFCQIEKMEFYRLLSIKFSLSELNYCSTEGIKFQQSVDQPLNQEQVQKYEIGNHSKWKLCDFIKDIVETHESFLTKYSQKNIHETLEITDKAINYYKTFNSRQNPNKNIGISHYHILSALQSVRNKIKEFNVCPKNKQSDQI